MTSFFTLATLISFLTLSSSSFSSACNNIDLKALLVFKNSFPSTPFPTWTTSKDCCSWDNVACDSSTGRVTSLSFFGNQVENPSVGLNGSIPTSIGGLTALESITISSLTSLVGTIPPQLSKLKNLKTLIIYSTKVSGPVPSFLSALPALEQITLANNMLEGTIPSSLGNLPNLNYIDLSGNQLHGAIPPSLFTKTKDKLPTFFVGGNKLTGEIPRSFGNVGFYNIDFHNNQLTGDASFLFGKSKPLAQITLAGNKLSFDLSHVEYPVLNLGYVDISHNQIYGTISNQITEVRNLGLFDVSYNKLCGKIPSGGNFGQFGTQSFEQNKCLCGTPLPACK
ncbi:polygalacturonase inhibitor-like [Iris pallida]|uniref:Polygalacturonase inhibitor-like n=1 Tax=Iris pallida TaxID=29817 RepID=A0AAX6GBZ4_IRIPA|nr:polygalacturonase inhibitor-like [Iris pallida]